MAWTERHPTTEPVALPEVYVGRSGIARALYEAADVLGDQGARRLPATGLAGNGHFLLDLAAATGQERYREWARQAAALIDA